MGGFVNDCYAAGAPDLAFLVHAWPKLGPWVCPCAIFMPQSLLLFIHFFLCCSPNFATHCLDTGGGEALMRRLSLVTPNITLGKGAQGMVVVGLWDGSTPVAVKLFKDEGWADDLGLDVANVEGQQPHKSDPRQNVLHEIAILSQVRHLGEGGRGAFLHAYHLVV